jgi:peroxiredoxin
MVAAGVGLLTLVAASWFALNSPGTALPQQAAGAAPAKGSGPPAPDFSVPTLGGGTFTLSAHRGKPVVLLFMAYWCGTCVPEAQALARLHQTYGERLAIAALDVAPSSTPERLQTFRQWAGEPGYVWAFDQGQRVAQAYRVRALDTTIIIDRAGQIVYRDALPTPYQTLQQQIAQLLE